MKVVKIILYVLGTLIALFLIVALFFPSDYEIERSVVINAPDSVIWAQISDLKNRRNWDPWSAIDTNAKSTISDPSSGVGATYTWEGEIIGSGSLTYVEVNEKQIIKSKLVFISPQSGEADVTWKLEPSQGGIKTTWAVAGGLSYPMERYFATMIENELNKSFDQGLTSLKNVCEQ